MEENKESKINILHKEIFRIKCPKRITIGDPYYFETESLARLKELVADYKPPRFYEGKIILTESEMLDLSEGKFNSIEIYMAPRETMETYIQGYMYEGQEVVQKPIGVDTAKYFMEIDGRRESFHTGADGYWGDVYEYRHTENQKVQVDGVLIVMTMPDYMSYENVKNTMDYLFEDMRLIQQEQIEKKSQKKTVPER